LEELGAFCKTPAYAEFVRKLIVQGLIKIEEEVVEIHARAEDRDVVTRMVSTAKSSFMFINYNLSPLFVPRLFILKLAPSSTCRLQEVDG
jgi:hypothetical protein